MTSSEILIQPELTEDELLEAMKCPWLERVNIDAIKVDLALGRGFSKPILYIPHRGAVMENQTQPTDEQINATKVAKGFSAFVYLSDIMQRYPFDLTVERGGRIFVDGNTDAKLRRKVIKGEPTQNKEFEVYQTIDKNNVVKQTIKVNDGITTPSILAGLAAAAVAGEDTNTHERIAIMLLQAGAALLQESDKARKAMDKLNPEGKVELNQFYDHLSSLHARAYAISIINDVAAYAVGDNPTINNTFADNLGFAQNGVDETVHGEGSKSEIMDGVNMLFSAIATLGHSRVFNDIIEMSDATKENLGESVQIELSGVEQV